VFTFDKVVTDYAMSCFLMDDSVRCTSVVNSLSRSCSCLQCIGIGIIHTWSLWV